MSQPRISALPLALIAALATLAALVPAVAIAQDLSAPAPADQTTFAITLPAQPLGNALNELARQAGLQLLVRRELVEGRQAPAVNGTLSARQALDRLLAGSGLSASIEGQTVVIGQGAGASTDGPRAEPVLSTVTVSGYRVDRVVGATRTDEALHDTPQSVQIINRERIEDEGLDSLNEALSRVSSVAAPQVRSVTIRGFYSEDYLRVDGLKGRNVRENTQVDLLSNIERIEVLKGPNAVLYGSGAVGGIVNLITKKPKADTAREIGLTVGSHGLRALEADLTGSLNDARSLRYRLVAATAHDGDFHENGNRRDNFIAPSLEWSAGNTSLLLQAEFRDAYRQPVYWSIYGYAPEGRLSREYRRRYYGSESDYDQSQGRVLSAKLTHYFDNNIELTAQLRSSRAKGYYQAHNGAGIDTDNRTLLRNYYAIDAQDKTDSATVYTVMPFDAGRFGQHKVMLGLDASRDDISGSRFCWAYGPGDCGLASVPSIDLLNPDTSIAAPSPVLGAGSPWVRTQTRWYLQDTIHFGERWVVVAGLAGNRFKERDESITGGPVSGSKVTPRFGVVYKPVREHALSLSASQSFIPQEAWSIFEGAPRTPQQGNQVELGWRYEPADRRFGLSAAIYQIDKKNVAYTDWVNQPDETWTLTRQRSKGFELEASGRLMPNWSLQASYGYNDARITTSPDPTEVGQRLRESNRHTLALWSRHDLTMLPGLSFGWGVRHVADLPPMFGQTRRAPNYTVWDAGLFYRQPGWDLALNVKNLTDELYAAWIMNQSVYSTYGAPRTVQLTLRTRF